MPLTIKEEEEKSYGKEVVALFFSFVILFFPLWFSIFFRPYEFAYMETKFNDDNTDDESDRT